MSNLKNSPTPNLVSLREDAVYYKQMQSKVTPATYKTISYTG